MPRREVVTALHAVVVLAVVELLIRWIPLPRLSRLLGVRVDLAPPRDSVAELQMTELSPRAQRELRCARRVADARPFSRGPCLRRSLVAGHLLRRLDPAVRLGVVGTEDQFVAHAWVEIDGRPLESVEGYHVFQQPTAGTTA
jgi:hypothetical protein